MKALDSAKAMLGALALGVGIAACGGAGGVDGPVLTSPSPGFFGGESLDGLVVGTLLFDEDRGCLLLQHPDDERIRRAVVWPAGTSWQPAPARVVLPDGQLVEPGMSVEGGGGYQSRAQVTEYAGSEVADSAATCVNARERIAVFNSDSEIVTTPAEST